MTLPDETKQARRAARAAWSARERERRNQTRLQQAEHQRAQQQRHTQALATILQFPQPARLSNRCADADHQHCTRYLTCQCWCHHRTNTRNNTA